MGIKPVLDLLIEMSIPKKYVKWLESLIRGGYAFTDVNTIKSAKFEIYSPSAQGSPLAATMPIIYKKVMIILTLIGSL